MSNKSLLLIICLFVFVRTSYAQKRPTIDRSKPKTENKVNISTQKKTTKKKKTSKVSNHSYFNISPQSASFDSDGGTQQFTISSSSPWDIYIGTYSWGHLSKNGNTLTLKVDKNNGSTSREDFFEIKSGSKTIRVNYFQSQGASLSVSTDNLSFDASGGSQTITISSSDTWRIGTNTYSWGHLEKDGNRLTVRVDANTEINSRNDYFTIKSGNIEKRVNISQSGQTTTSSKSAVIKSVTVSNNAVVNGKYGLSVHVSFDIYGMKDTEGRVSCYFSDNYGNMLVNTNAYYGTDGSPSQVAAGYVFKPKYEETSFSDVQVVIPYDELHISGTYSRTLKVNVIIWDYEKSIPVVLSQKNEISFTCSPKY